MHSASGAQRTHVPDEHVAVLIRQADIGEQDLRPVIFRLAAERGWTLWELHRERESLEHLFRSVTARPVEEPAEPEAPWQEEAADAAEPAGVAGGGEA